MRLQTEESGDVLVVRLCGPRLDLASVLVFKEGMRGLSSRPAARVILDFAEVSFLDSSGLGGLLAIMTLLMPRPLELAAVSPPVLQTLQLTRMDRVFTIHPDLRSGLRDPG